MAATILSVLMLAGFALLAGGLYLLIGKRDRRRGALMLVAALVMFGNVGIWLIPDQSGQTLSGTAAKNGP
jgi:cyanate permease